MTLKELVPKPRRAYAFQLTKEMLEGKEPFPYRSLSVKFLANNYYVYHTFGPTEDECHEHEVKAGGWMVWGRWEGHCPSWSYMTDKELFEQFDEK